MYRKYVFYWNDGRITSAIAENSIYALNKLGIYGSSGISKAVAELRELKIVDLI